MAKRFIDTELFNDEWFMDLSKDAKLFYIYLFTNCDHAGVIKLNTKLVQFQLKINSIATITQELGNRLVRVKNETYFLTRYLCFQYPNFPNSKVKQQESALNILNELGIDFKGYHSVTEPLAKGHEHEHDNDNVIEHVKEGECEGEIKKDAAYLVRGIWGKNPVGLDISSTNKLIDHFGFDECNIAFRKSHKAQAKTFSYVEKILKNRAKEKKSKEMNDAYENNMREEGKLKAEDQKTYNFGADSTFQKLLKKVDTKKPDNGKKKKKDFEKEVIKRPTSKPVDETDPKYLESKREFEKEVENANKD